MTYEQLVTLLKGIPASRVEKAEVMYSAPPQYHVRGAAINLVLKGYKPGEGGLQGEVNGEYKQQKEAGATEASHWPILLLKLTLISCTIFKATILVATLISSPGIR